MKQDISIKKSRHCRIFSITILIVALIALLSAGCSANDAGIVKWTSAISVEDIGSVQLVELYEPGGQSSFDLPKEKYSELVTVLHGIAAHEVTMISRGGDVVQDHGAYHMYIETPTEENPWFGWLFKCMLDGSVMLTFEDFETAAEYGYTEKTGVNPWIYNDELYNFIVSAITEAEVLSARNAVEETETTELFVPSVEEVREHGYPVNENGETYGPAVKDSDESPDLVLVKYNDSYGYVRKSELDDDGVTTLEEAVERMQNYQPRKINVYMQDGVTVIGELELSIGGMEEVLPEAED